MNKIILVIVGALLIAGIFGFVFYMDSQGKAEETISANAPKFADKNNEAQTIIEMKNERRRKGAPLEEETRRGAEGSEVMPRSPVRSYGVGGALATVSTAGDGAGEEERSDWRFTAPYGRLLKCSLMNTLQSIDLATPIIGVVTEDLVWDGEVIIPAGSEVHGRAANDRSRERLGAADRWILILKEDRYKTRREMVINGLVLDRSYDDEKDTFGPLDGSAGFRGKVIDNVDEKMIRLFAATFIQGLSSGFTETQTNGLGTLQVVPTVQNAALGGTRQLLGEVAQQIKAEIEREGYYTQVAGGTEFYIYIQEGVDRENAKEGLSLPNQQKKSIYGQIDPAGKLKDQLDE